MGMEVAEEPEVRPVGRQRLVDGLQPMRRDHRAAAALGVGVDNRHVDVEAPALARRYRLVTPQQAEGLALSRQSPGLAAPARYQEAFDGGDHHALESSLGNIDQVIELGGGGG